jgi:hypothetical protein
LVLAEDLRFELHGPAIPAGDGQIVLVVSVLRALQIDMRMDMIVRVRVTRRKDKPLRMRMPRPIRVNMLV